MIASREWKDWSKYSIWLFLGSRLTGSDAVLKNKLIPPFLPWLKSQWQFHNEKKKAWKREGSWSLWHPTLFARSGKKWPIILVIGFSRQRPVNRTKEKLFSQFKIMFLALEISRGWIRFTHVNNCNCLNKNNLGKGGNNLDFICPVDLEFAKECELSVSKWSRGFFPAVSFSRPKFRQLLQPDETFHSLKASKSEDRWISWSSKAMFREFSGSILAKLSVGILLCFPCSGGNNPGIRKKRTTWQNFSQF